MKIAIFGSRHQDRHIEPLTHFLEALVVLRPQVSLMIEERFFTYVSALIQIDWTPFEVFTRLDSAPDTALSIGGDGTFLRVAKAVGRLGTPILGVNTGHLGYLSAADIAEGQQVISDLLEGKFVTDPRSLLRVESDSPELRGVRYALNEVALLRRDTASMITVDAHLNSLPLARYTGDGLIVSTPTGSTGYNLSVGGPLVAPDTSCWIIAPIAPHSLNMRPLVVSDRRSTIRMSCQARSETFLLSLDGKATVLPIDASITVTRAPFTVNLLHRPDQNFTNTIRTKLGWNS